MVCFKLLSSHKLFRCLGKFCRIENTPDSKWNLVRRWRATKHSRNAVVFGDSDRIKFVIVATNATECHSQERRADLNDLSVNVVRFQFGLVWFNDLNITDHQETCADDILGSFFRCFCRHQVASDLLTHKSVEWFVLLIRGDQIIAITPRMFGEDVVRCPHHVCVPGQVEPVPRPTLAVGSRIEQPIDHGFECLRRLVADKRCDLGRRRWQARQVQADSPQPREAISIRNGFQTLGIESRQNESIEGNQRPHGVSD